MWRMLLLMLMLMLTMSVTERKKRKDILHIIYRQMNLNYDCAKYIYIHKSLSLFWRVWGRQREQGQLWRRAQHQQQQHTFTVKTSGRTHRIKNQLAVHHVDESQHQQSEKHEGCIWFWKPARRNHHNELFILESTV